MQEENCDQLPEGEKLQNSPFGYGKMTIPNSAISWKKKLKIHRSVEKKIFKIHQSVAEKNNEFF